MAEEHTQIHDTMAGEAVARVREVLSEETSPDDWTLKK
jgi:hypothetical protein